MLTWAQNKKTEYFLVSLQINHLSQPGKNVAVSAVLSTPGGLPDTQKKTHFSACLPGLTIDFLCRCGIIVLGGNPGKIDKKGAKQNGPNENPNLSRSYDPGADAEA